MVCVSRWNRVLSGVVLLALMLTGFAVAFPTDAPEMSALDLPILFAAVGQQGNGPLGAGSATNDSVPGRYGQQDQSTQTGVPTPVPTTDSATTDTSTSTPTIVTPTSSPGIQQANGSGNQGNRPENTPAAGGSNAIALIAGLMLAALVGLADYRQKNGWIDSTTWRREGLLFFSIVAIAIFATLFIIAIPGRGFVTQGAFALVVSLGGTAVVLAVMFYQRVWFRMTLWFQVLGSAACAVVLPVLGYLNGSTVSQYIPYIMLFAVSAVGAGFFIRKIHRGSSEIGARNATIVGGSPVDPNLIPAAMSEPYTDLALIATGGLAKVYRATRRQDGTTVAVKVPLHANEATGASFMKEMLHWRNLHHPNIVSVIGVGILPFPYVEMEYIERSLADIPKPVDVDTAVQYICGIAEGLAYAHSKGIIHRDIKPENILVTPEGTPKISDWGMSRDVAARDLPTVAGFSLSYAAPEQLAPSQYHGTDQRTDIFQLGIVFYELVTGRLPFPGDGIGEVSSAILTKDPIRPSAIVPEAHRIEPIICRCLRKDPADRYQSVDELLASLSTSRFSA